MEVIEGFWEELILIDLGVMSEVWMGETDVSVGNLGVFGIGWFELEWC